MASIYEILASINRRNIFLLNYAFYFIFELKHKKNSNKIFGYFFKKLVLHECQKFKKYYSKWTFIVGDNNDSYVFFLLLTIPELTLGGSNKKTKRIFHHSNFFLVFIKINQLVVNKKWNEDVEIDAMRQKALKTCVLRKLPSLIKHALFKHERFLSQALTMHRAR